MEGYNEKSPLVSVVMPTYNGAQFIREAIDSILSQSFKEFEFIIVDDGSMDETEEIIRSYADKRIVYIKKEQNSGISDSLNRGISLSRGKYIARMDDDDISLPHRFETQLKVFENNSKIIVCGSVSEIDNGKKKSNNPESHDEIKLSLLFHNCMIHPSVMMLKKPLELALYNVDFVPSEDYDLWSRLIWEGEFYNIQNPLIQYRDHDDSETSTRRKEQLEQNVKIGWFYYNKLGFDRSVNSKKYIRIFCVHDYSVSGRQLTKMLYWFEEIKAINRDMKIFNTTQFENKANSAITRFVTSYFINRKLKNKIIPFLLLNSRYKRIIINYYYKKNKD